MPAIQTEWALPNPTTEQAWAIPKGQRASAILKVQQSKNLKVQQSTNRKLLALGFHFALAREIVLAW
jgi:hypothetical protein